MTIASKFGWIDSWFSKSSAQAFFCCGLDIKKPGEKIAKRTPFMAAGFTDKVWKMEELLKYVPVKSSQLGTLPKILYMPVKPVSVL